MSRIFQFQKHVKVLIFSVFPETPSFSLFYWVLHLHFVAYLHHQNGKEWVENYIKICGLHESKNFHYLS